MSILILKIHGVTFIEMSAKLYFTKCLFLPEKVVRSRKNCLNKM